MENQMKKEQINGTGTQIKRLYVSLPEVATMVTLATATIQRLVREDQFPKPRKISPNRVAWLVREVEAWAEERPVSDLPPPPNTGSRKNASRVPVPPDAHGA